MTHRKCKSKVSGKGCWSYRAREAGKRFTRRSWRRSTSRLNSSVGPPGARCGQPRLKAAELGKLRDEISERGLAPVGSAEQFPHHRAHRPGLGSGNPPQQAAPRAQHSARWKPHLHGGEGAILVRRTLRSGYSLQHSGHVVVIGDVNPGAEIIAGGDVIVWGHLRGMVHAGAEGNEDAVVCALDLSPTQLRIAGQIATTPKRRGKPQPEMARLKDGQVVAETWNPKRK